MLTVIPLAQDLAPSEASFNHSSVPTARRARVRAHYKLFTYFPLPFTSVFLEKFSENWGPSQTHQASCFHGYSFSWLFRVLVSQ